MDGRRMTWRLVDAMMNELLDDRIDKIPIVEHLEERMDR